MQERGLVLEQHDRITFVGHVNLRDPRGEGRVRRNRVEHAGSERRAALIDQRLPARNPADDAIDKWKIEIRVTRTVLVDDHSGTIEQVDISAETAQTDRHAL